MRKIPPIPDTRGKMDTDVIKSLYFFFIGLARFFLTWLYSSASTIAAYRIARNIHHEYLKAALRQEFAYFDAGKSGPIAVQAANNGKLI